MENKEIAIMSDGGKSELIRFPNGEANVVGPLEACSLSVKGIQVLSPDKTKELLAQNKIPTYKCNVKK